MSGLTTRSKTSVNENKSRKVGRLLLTFKWRTQHWVEKELFIHVVKRMEKSKKMLYDYFSAHTQQHRHHRRSGAWHGCKYYVKWHGSIKTQQKVRFYHSRRKFLSFNPLYNQLFLDFHFPTSFLPTRRVCLLYGVMCARPAMCLYLCCVLRQRR